MFSTCYSLPQVCFGSLPIRALCFRTTVAGRAGTFLRTATMRTSIERFWTKVNKDGPIPAHMPHLGKCWIWIGYIKKKGYGVFYDHNHKKTNAHRWIYANLNNLELTTTDFICHHCDVRNCVNPSHLFLGDNKANMEDRSRKGRHPNSLKTHCAKGHPYSPENTHVRPASGYRHCRECGHIRDRKRDRRYAK